MKDCTVTSDSVKQRTASSGIDSHADGGNGITIHDPTGGQLRSCSGSDLQNEIAGWFLDTDHDGEAFFVRHAYFTGADDPYEKLRRALKADIAPEAWDTINSTVSRPFPRPSNGKIAIKVINHYGDEVLKVISAA